MDACSISVAAGTPWRITLRGPIKKNMKVNNKNKTTTLTQFPIKYFLTPLRYKINLRAHRTYN